MDRIMDNARYVIEKNPSRLHDVSTTSGCTVLHVALRNYGNHHGLVEFLLDLDTDNRLVAHRNVFGDLPLHVACLVGVPWQVLRLVLDKTLLAGTNSSRQEPTVPGQAHSLLWSINHAGRTPVDLEWMRHIEGGKGLSESRSFYPLEERGITFQNGRMEDMYRNLLRDAVQQATTAKQFVNGTNSPLDAEETSDVCFGTLLSRILLVVQMAYRSCPSDEVLVANHNGRPDVTRDHLLHAVSTLMNPTGPTLPEPFLLLFSFLHGDQMTKTDHNGMLPLHCALIHSTKRTTSTTTTGTATTAAASKHADQNTVKGHVGIGFLDCHHPYQNPSRFESCAEHRRWIQHLLKQRPGTARVADKSFRLPLHYALDPTTSTVSTDGPDSPVLFGYEGHNRARPYSSLFWNRTSRVNQNNNNNSNNNNNTNNEDCEMSSCTNHLETIQQLVEAFPDAVERRDPHSLLYPFQQAASHPSLDKPDVVLFLLQRAPALLLAKTNRHHVEDQHQRTAQEPLSTQ